MTTPNPGITGTDGQTPIYNPDGRWTTYALTEIYRGTVALGRFIPNVDDFVADVDSGHRYKVTAVDPTTFIPTLTPFDDETSVGEFDDTDRLLGVGPGRKSMTYRAFIDKSVTPYRLSVDHRLYYPNTGAVTAKIFRGTVLNPQADVVSQVYNNSGDLTGNLLGLTAVQINGQSSNMKTVPTCSTTFDLQNNEVLTVVAYNSSGIPTDKTELMVENSGFIPRADASAKYVQTIELLSPWLSSSDNTLLQYPVNILRQGLNLLGKVNYSDGTSLVLPVDQTKFSLFGWRDFVATIVGAEQPLTLKYTFASNEASEGGGSGADRFLAKQYTGQTQSMDGAFSVKLYGYPVWVDSVNGYNLKWFLYNLDRNTVFDVTPYVSFSDNAPAFSPLLYGTNQHMSVNLNLHDVNGSFRNYIHTQTIDITLLGAGTLRSTNWTVGFEPNQSPLFGLGLHADTVFTNSTLATVTLASGQTSQAAWLAKLYSAAKPLYDPSAEISPPAPTHFALVLNGGDVVYPLSMWNAVITLNQALTNNGTLFVKFIRRTSDTDLQLAIAAMPIYQTN